MKLVVETNDLKILNHHVMELIDVLVVGYNELSLDAGIDVDYNLLEKVSNDVHQKGKKLWINVKRIVHEDEIGKVRSEVAKIIDLVDGFMYTDMLYNELLSDYKVLKIYAPTTYVTNQRDLVILKKYHDVVLASPEISITELSVLGGKGSLCYLFGQMSIFYSRRRLLSNYYDYRGLEYDSNKMYRIKEELRDEYLPIREGTYGTNIYLDSFYNVINYLESLKSFEYGLISGLFLDFTELISVVDAFVSGDFSKVCIPTTNGALTNKTILLKDGE